METEKVPAEGPVDRPVRPPTFRAKLVCWHCGAAREVLTHGPAHFAFEVAGWANDAGMKGFFDPEHDRVLVFLQRRPRAPADDKGWALSTAAEASGLTPEFSRCRRQSAGTKC